VGVIKKLHKKKDTHLCEQAQRGVRISTAGRGLVQTLSHDMIPLCLGLPLMRAFKRLDDSRYSRERIEAWLVTIEANDHSFACQPCWETMSLG